MSLIKLTLFSGYLVFDEYRVQDPVNLPLPVLGSNLEGLAGIFTDLFASYIYNPQKLKDCKKNI